MIARPVGNKAEGCFWSHRLKDSPDCHKNITPAEGPKMSPMAKMGLDCRSKAGVETGCIGWRL